MEDTEFDRALVAAAFEQASLTGWDALSIVDAARSAGLPLDRVRVRFPGRGAVLMRFGVLADEAMLKETAPELSVRDRIFDLVMRRIDVLQQHREGMVALLRYLPRDPGLSLALSLATGRSMGWLLEAAGVSAQGFRGRLRPAGLVALWVYVVRAWAEDDSPDLPKTMAALDRALDRAEQTARTVGDTMFDIPPEMPDDDLGVPSDSPIEPDEMLDLEAEPAAATPPVPSETPSPEAPSPGTLPT